MAVSSSESGAPRAGALALVADLIFASRVRAAAAAVGVPVRTVSSAAALLREARSGKAGVILIDLEARGVDAPRLIAELKADPELAETPLIAFGAHVRGEALRAAQAAGADRVLARSAFVRALPTILAGAGAGEDG
ncbi:MAG TPA: hypothetical protein VF188_01895 [Longimicrobiales bacterium]